LGDSYARSDNCGQVFPAGFFHFPTAGIFTSVVNNGDVDAFPVDVFPGALCGWWRICGTVTGFRYRCRYRCWFGLGDLVGCGFRGEVTNTTPSSWRWSKRTGHTHPFRHNDRSIPVTPPLSANTRGITPDNTPYRVVPKRPQQAHSQVQLGVGGEVLCGVYCIFCMCLHSKCVSD